MFLRPNYKNIAAVIISFAAIASVFAYFSKGKVEKFEFGNNSIQEPQEEKNTSTDIIPEKKSEPEEVVEKEGTREDKMAENKAEIDKLTEKESGKSLDISSRFVGWGYGKSSGRTIDTIVIHSPYNALGGDAYDIDKLLAEYKSYGVAPHYVIGRNGKIYQLVEDKNIAYHAGESKTPDGRTGVNNFSVGIEIVTTKSEKPTSEQYSSLKKLLTILKSKYKMKYILGHSDIAKGRKDDPWNFDWSKI